MDRLVEPKRSTIAICALAFFGQPSPYLVQDPIHPPKQTFNYTFECEEQHVSATFVTTYSQDREEKIWETSLEELRINGVSVNTDIALQTSFSSFATIESVTPMCVTDGVNIRLIGLDKLAWEAFLREETGRPGPYSKTIVISKSGQVTTQN